MTRTQRPISPLRQRMIDNMCLRKLNPKTQIAYVRAVGKLARFLRRSPDAASAEDLRRFQLQLVEDGASSVTINATITGLRFFFDVTVDRAEAMKKMSHVSRLFRRLFLEQLLQAHHAGKLTFYGRHQALAEAHAFAEFLKPLRRIDWVVYAKRPFAGPKAV